MNTLDQIYALPRDSRLWVFASNKKLNSKDVELLQDEMDKFLSTWNAHGTELSGYYVILHDYFVIVAVNEQSHGASGCSIDSLTNKLKVLGKNIGLNFFDRSIIHLEKELEYIAVNKSDLSTYCTKDTNLELQMVNLGIHSINQFRNNWLVPVPKHWYSATQDENENFTLVL